MKELMSRVMNPSRAGIRVLEPFAVFGIVIGLGIKLGIPAGEAALGLSVETKMMLTKAVWFAASLGGLVYTAVFFRHLRNTGWANAILYVSLLLIFAVLAGFTPFL